jgi:hypothetical protein
MDPSPGQVIHSNGARNIPLVMSLLAERPRRPKDASPWQALPSKTTHWAIMGMVHRNKGRTLLDRSALEDILKEPTKWS